ncbi:hypothetical protein F4777DRAFT_30232 [Nemania sp. FL0916]|nr:hypothetical protein F4777DRAFT_30232 [Nemania sp. FL0916]
MPPEAGMNTQQRERSLWTALTHLEGFDIPTEPPFAGRDLNNFSKAVISSAPWRNLTQRDLAARVASIFETACDVYKSEDNPFSNRAFYISVAKKAGRRRFKDNDIFKHVIETYANGLKRAAARSEGYLYVDRRSAPAALRVAEWIELTEATIINITTKEPPDSRNNPAPAPAPDQRHRDSSTPPQQSRKRSAETVKDEGDDEIDGKSKVRRQIRFQDALAERDQAYRDLEAARTQIADMTQRIAAIKHQYRAQSTHLANAQLEIDDKTRKLRDANLKEEKLLKAIRAVQNDRNDAIAYLKRHYADDDRDSEYFASVEADWRTATRELRSARRERDDLKQTLAECRALVEPLSSRLSSGELPSLPPPNV